MQNSLYKPILLWIIKISLFVVPFIPLVIFKSMFFPFITGKAFIFRTLIEIAFFLWVFLAIFYKEYRPRLNALTISIGIFLIVVSLATIFGVNPLKSFWSNFERMEGLITYLHLGAYFLILAHIFEKKDWIIFFNLFVVSGIIENFYVLLQKVGYLASPQGGVRVDGTIGNSTYLAAYLIFLLGFTAILLLHSKSRNGKIFYGAASVFTLMSIYFTATRGAILALIIGGFIFSIIYLLLAKSNTDKSRLHKKIGLYVLGSIIALPLLFSLLKNTDIVASSPVLSRFRNLSFDDARSYIWQMSYEGFKENPILGWGPDNYNVVFSKYYRPELYAQEPWFDRSHNIVLDWLINAGMLGLASYLSIFGSAFYLMWSTYKKDKVSLEVVTALSILLLVYFLQNMFVFDNIATYLSFFAILAYIYNISVFEDPLELKTTSSRHAGYRSVFDMVYAPLVGAVLVLPLAYVLYAWNAKPLLANLALLNGLKVRTVQDVGAGFDEFKRALVYDTLGNMEVREQFARFAQIVVATEGIPDAMKLDMFKFALEETDKSVKENPDDARPILFLSSLLVKAQLHDQAIAALNKALEISPEKQQIFFELADIYLKAENYTKAIEILERAWKLEPRFRQAEVNLVAALILGGKNVEADNHIKSMYEGGYDAEPIMVQVYKKTGDFKRLLPFQMAFVKSHPENWDYRREVADTFLKLGRKSEAIKFIEEAISEQPKFKSDAESYLRLIR